MSQLYDVVQKWDAMSTSVPQVVQRLVAVKELHEQGNQVVEVGKLGKRKVLAKQLGQSIFRTAALVLCCAVQKRSQASRH